MYTLDFETYYAKDFGLKKNTTEEYIRSPRFQIIGVSLKRDDGPVEWIPGTEDVAARLKEYDLHKETVIAHNAAFDMAILNWRCGIKPKFIIDTLSISRPITGMSVGGSLRALAEYFDIGRKGDEVYNTIGKRLEDFSPEELQRFGDYCKNDVELTWKLWHKLKELTTPRELALIDLTIRMFTEPVLELNEGLLVNRLAEVREDKQRILDSVSHSGREAFMSNDQFAELLRAEGVEPPMKVSPKTGKEAYAFAKTDVGFQELLSHPNERVQALAAARLGLKSTIEETRTEAFLNISRRGTLPVMLTYYGAVNTGRFSASGEKTNPQNLPRGGVLREAIEAPEGYRLVACDSSNVEARTLAWLAGQADLVEKFAAGVDVYSSFASTVYGKPINKHDNPTERFVGKTCLAGDTQVLTDSGWKCIKDISANDLLWDGEEWVTHDGVVNNGTKNTVSLAGVKATPDHLCWDGTTWLPFQALVTDGRAFQRALASASLPSSDTQGTFQKVGVPTDGSRTANAPVDGKAAS